MPDPVYYAGLPRTRGAAGALILDERGRVLVVKPVYQSVWTIPGGVIETDESPLAACRREVGEELGVTPTVEWLVGVDWIPPQPGKSAANMFVFAAVLSPGQVRAIKLADDELAGYDFISPEQFGRLLSPQGARRLSACVRAYTDKRTVYLEHGHEPV